MATAIGQWEPGSADWLSARRWRLGGSDIGAVVGWSPFDTRADLLFRKAYGGEVPASNAMVRGTLLEPAVMTYAASRGFVADPDLAGTYVSDEHDWMLANPDGITADGVLVEAKAPRVRGDGWGRGGTAQIPAHYLAQVTWYCGVLGLDRWVLAVIATKQSAIGPDFDMALYKGRFSPALFAGLTKHGQRFMDELADERSVAA